LAIYLKERDLKELGDVVKLADTYLDARLQRDSKDKKNMQTLLLKSNSSEDE